MRFNIRIDAVWRGLVLLAGATPRNSYVFLGDEGMHFRFGLAFNRTVPYDQIAAVFPRSWPLLYGVGARSNLRGVIGLTGSYHDVVEVRLKTRVRNWLAVFPCDRIAVSLEEPELFIEELSRRTGLAEPPDINALSKPTRRPTRPAKEAADSGQQTAKAASPRPKATPKATSPAAKANGTKAVAPAPRTAPRKRAARPPVGRTAVRSRRRRSS